MNRYIDLKEVSDGKLYTSNDLVKAGCGDCAGCSSCCETMADTIILDPMDLFWLTRCLDATAADLLSRSGVMELGVVDGVILPHIRMDDDTGRCPFLTEAGRCSIHDSRPGFCRLFPLGRYYENRSFRYFLQVNECRRVNRTKVKVRKWIGVADFERYETFIADWHYFLKDLEEPLAGNGIQWAKQVNTLILNEFFFWAYDARADFYSQFYERLEAVRETVSAYGKEYGTEQKM